MTWSFTPHWPTQAGKIRCNDSNAAVMANANSNTVPLCVDLDGTLVRSDMLIESILILARQSPWSLFKLPHWLIKGKSVLKHEVAQRCDLSDAVVPYNQEVIDYVTNERSKRKAVLVTGSHHSIAELVQQQTGLFDEIKGSDESVNLTSHRKGEWLVSEFGEQGFDYIGNDSDDLNVWPLAREAMVVSRPNGIVSKTSQTFSKIFELPSTNVKDYLSLLRVHQWSKNVLVLVPFALDQRFGDWPSTFAILLAFFAMCLLASLTYIVNDMLDLQADRQNETKAKRALPSTRITLEEGAKIGLLLALAVVILGFFLPAAFNLILLCYTAMTLSYSFVLKRYVILDVCMIAALHTLRVVGGTVAIAAEWSFWLLAFSMFIFFSLALAKRVAELINLQKANKEKTLGRDYRVSDLPVLISTGVSTGYLSVLIVALYINSDKVRVMYNTPDFLWLVCPILMYWIGRLWMITARGEMHEDPIIFAMRDRTSLDIAGVVAVVVVAAKLIG